MGERGHSVTTSVPGPRQPAVAPCPALSARLGCVATWDKNSRVILRLEVGLHVEIRHLRDPLSAHGWWWQVDPGPHLHAPRGQQDTDFYHWGKAWGAGYTQGLRSCEAPGSSEEDTALRGSQVQREGSVAPPPALSLSTAASL